MTTPTQVFQAVAAAFDVPETFITSKARTQWIAFARFAAWHILRERKKYLSLERIGWMSGQRHHTAVMHGVRQANFMLHREAEFAEAYNAAIAIIENQDHITTIYT